MISELFPVNYSADCFLEFYTLYINKFVFYSQITSRQIGLFIKFSFTSLFRPLFLFFSFYCKIASRLVAYLFILCFY